MESTIPGLIEAPANYLMSYQHPNNTEKWDKDNTQLVHSVTIVKAAGKCPMTLSWASHTGEPAQLFEIERFAVVADSNLSVTVGEERVLQMIAEGSQLFNTLAPQIDPGRFAKLGE